MRTRAKTMRKVTLLLAAMALAVLLAALPAQAGTPYTVNATTDASDANTTDGVCATAAGQCTLRAAIEQANASAGDDVIGFAPSVSGTIVLGSNELTINSNLEIDGPGANVLSVSANNQSRVINVQDGTVGISELAVTGGSADTYGGGGIANYGTLTVSNSAITNNTTDGSGGGIFNQGNLMVSNSTISDNTADDSGGGIFSQAGTLRVLNSTISDNTSDGSGGGIANWVGGTGTVERSTISGNTAGGGGGIYSYSTTTVANSTISGNSSFSDGGGVLNNGRLTKIEHSTITDNTAAQLMGSGVSTYGDSTEVYSSIISGNKNIDDFGSHPTRDVDGYIDSYSSRGFNLIGISEHNAASFNQSGDQTGVADPKLEALSLNGGSTMTHALKEGSPALNAGPPDPQCAEVDQRGANRPQEGTCDIGSFERDLTAPDAPVIKSPAEGSLKSGSFSVSGTAEASAKVELFEWSVSKGETTADANGAWSIVLSGVSEGSHTYKARATDAAGNTSAESAARTVTVDATAPDAPVIKSPVEDARLNRGSFSVSGSAEPGAKIELFEETASKGTDVADSNGVWSMVLSGVTDGSHSYSAKATDAAGNTSVQSEARTVIVDTTAPEAPIITSPAEGSYDSDGTFTVSGTAEADSFVELFEGATRRGTAQAQDSGEWRIALSGVAEGSHTYKAKAIDKTGNTSAESGARTIIVDATAPEAPVITSPVEGARLNLRSFTISGTAEPNSSVELFDGGNPVRIYAGGQGSDGSWWFELRDVSDGSHSYTAKATDAAGNASAESAARTVIVDTIAPSVSEVLPQENATGIAPASDVRAVFSEAMSDASIDQRTFKLYKKRSTTAIAATVTYEADTMTAVLDPSANLKRGATYRAVLTSGAKDLAGNQLGQQKVWFFTIRK